MKTIILGLLLIVLVSCASVNSDLLKRTEEYTSTVSVPGHTWYECQVLIHAHHVSFKQEGINIRHHQIPE